MNNDACSKKKSLKKAISTDHVRKIFIEEQPLSKVYSGLYTSLIPICGKGEVSFGFIILFTTDRLSHSSNHFDLKGHISGLNHHSKEVSTSPAYSNFPLSWNGYYLIILLLLMLLIAKCVYRRRVIKRKLQFQMLKIEHRNQIITTLGAQKDEIRYSNERLVREIHLRVKNNLNMIMKLLDSQSASLRDHVAQEAIGQSKSRVKAMALIHEKVHGFSGIEYVEIAGYIIDVVKHLDTSELIRFKYSLATLELDLSRAEPLGLLLSEIITNSLKHAFTPGDDNVIVIALQYLADDYVRISITDNGKSLSPDFNIDKSHTFGIRLMRGLASQLEAELDFISHEGYSVSVQFQHRIYN